MSYRSTDKFVPVNTTKPSRASIIQPYSLLTQALGAMWAGIAQSLYRLATGWTVWGSNPSGGHNFRTCPDRNLGPTQLPRLLPGCKAAGP